MGASHPHAFCFSKHQAKHPFSSSQPQKQDFVCSLQCHAPKQICKCYLASLLPLQLNGNHFSSSSLTTSSCTIQIPSFSLPLNDQDFTILLFLEKRKIKIWCTNSFSFYVFSCFNYAQDHLTSSGTKIVNLSGTHLDIKFFQDCQYHELCESIKDQSNGHWLIAKRAPNIQFYMVWSQCKL